MFLCSLIEELCRKEESDKTDCNFNFGHECISKKQKKNILEHVPQKNYKIPFKQIYCA